MQTDEFRIGSLSKEHPYTWEGVYELTQQLPCVFQRLSNLVEEYDAYVDKLFACMKDPPYEHANLHVSILLMDLLCIQLRASNYAEGVSEMFGYSTGSYYFNTVADLFRRKYYKTRQAVETWRKSFE